MRSLKYWVWLSSISGVGAITSMRLIKHFGDPEKVFYAKRLDFDTIEGVSARELGGVFEKSLDKANKVLASCEELGIKVVTFYDKLYPDRLRNIYDPPPVLYVSGNMPYIDDEPIVSIVGTRDCTPYGISCANGISRELARSGIIVATGLALGVDTAAAVGALSSGGKVIGIVGSGHGIIYPPENKELFGDVENFGAIISEYPPHTPAVRWHFPARNRLLAGISLGVAVIEAPKRSGALITASRALEQGRDVFALPGNVDAVSCVGSNALLRDGAIPILSADDIISEYIDLFPNKISRVPLDDASHIGNTYEKKHVYKSDLTASTKPKSKKEIDNTSVVDYIDVDMIIDSLEGNARIIAEYIGSNAAHIDEIIMGTALSPSQVLSEITMLEIKGIITASSGKNYSLTKLKML